jgi:putative hydrolase of the HAD superfamily
VRYRAVVFDLWQTLAVWPYEAGRDLNARMAEVVGVDTERFTEAWGVGMDKRGTGPIRPYLESLCQQLGVDGADIEELTRLRVDHTREMLVPRPDAVSTLEALRKRGYRIGLITVCSEEVEQLWPETKLAPHFDATVFSCSVGINKPDPRVYRLACEHLSVDPAEAVFVGDGAHDELPGAERVGMRAIQLRVPGEQLAPEAEVWSGERVESLSELLELL